MTDSRIADRPIGDRLVNPVGLGNAGHGLVDGGRVAGVAALRTALDAGIRLLDTARVYTTADHEGSGEELLAEALVGHPAGAEAFVVTKGGHFRSGDEFLVDGRPETIRRHFDLSRRFLGDRIDLYLLHCPDPEVPIGRTMEAFAELRDAGAVRHVGVDSVTVAQLREAMSVVPVAAVEKQFGPFAQGDRDLLDFCAEHGIAFLAHSPLRGRYGLADPPTLGDLGAAFPASAAVAARIGVPLPRLALAWLLTTSPALFVVSGASRAETIRDTALVRDLVLPDEVLAELDFDRPGVDLGAVS